MGIAEIWVEYLGDEVKRRLWSEKKSHETRVLDDGCWLISVRYN